jgi:ribose 5-phosphate isomerase B
MTRRRAGPRGIVWPADLEIRHMKIVVACDHRGFEAKRRLMPVLKTLGHEVRDLGCDAAGSSVDYPDFAGPAARIIADGGADLAILLDGSGIGMCVVANKVVGVRAAVIHDQVMARRAREHHHCTVLCLGADLLGEDQIRQIAETFLATELGNGRHLRRLEKVRMIESEQRQPPQPPATG